MAFYCTPHPPPTPFKELWSVNKVQGIMCSLEKQREAKPERYWSWTSRRLRKTKRTRENEQITVKHFFTGRFHSITYRWEFEGLLGRIKEIPTDGTKFSNSSRIHLQLGTHALTYWLICLFYGQLRKLSSLVFSRIINKRAADSYNDIESFILLTTSKLLRFTLLFSKLHSANPPADGSLCNNFHYLSVSFCGM